LANNIQGGFSMAMINCRECGKEVSDQAATCPNCGVSIREKKIPIVLTKKTKIISVVLAAVVVVGGVGAVVGNKIHQNSLTKKAEAAIIVRDQKAFDTAKDAYTELSNAADLTISVMDSIYGAWYFGIYKAKDSSTTTVIADLAKNTSLSQSDLQKALKSTADKYDVSEATLLWALADKADSISSWQFCLDVVKEAYSINGTFDRIQSSIDTADASLKTMTAEFDDYKHYPTLKDFYSKVASYAEFAQSPTGSFQQLKDTISDYENSIRTYRTDLSFVFG
jgi:hypothetical protein